MTIYYTIIGVKCILQVRELRQWNQIKRNLFFSFYFFLYKNEDLGVDNKNDWIMLWRRVSGDNGSRYYMIDKIFWCWRNAKR